MSTALAETEEIVEKGADDLAPVQELVLACIQCGTCTGSCPNAFAMDRTPRQMWRLVLTGRKEAIFTSQTFSLCSACYQCTLRCPRGLPLTEAIGLLKQIAARNRLPLYKKSCLFYESFLSSVRRHGKVREMEFMTLYFLSMKNPFLPLKFSSLGMRLLGKGKVSLQVPSRGKRPLEALFQKVAEMEAEK
ncbi:MAG: 4Fe-4S dicluster domain-containing protein [Desulfobacterales bacterium]|nr:4Fe-4S dicluster domain-containing protein [Desulfobacterales bacterium]